VNFIQNIFEQPSDVRSEDAKWVKIIDGPRIFATCFLFFWGGGGAGRIFV
jgi:hypothetical protein